MVRELIFPLTEATIYSKTRQSKRTELSTIADNVYGNRNDGEVTKISLDRPHAKLNGDYFMV